MSERAGLDARAALVLDDEPLIALDIAAALQELGFGPVEIAGDLIQAEAKFRNSHAGVVILDVNLGAGVTSVSFGKGLSERGVKVFFSSGYGLADLPAGVALFPFIEKPATRERLQELFRDVRP